MIRLDCEGGSIYLRRMRPGRRRVNPDSTGETPMLPVAAVGAAMS